MQRLHVTRICLYGKFSEKSDVFSIGVLMSGIMSGKRNTSFHLTKLSLTLLGWILMLSNENASIPSPKEPAFSTCRSSNTVNYPSQTLSSYSSNEVTISMLEAQ
ncbi:unnamed protein product [Camellia sinensis]